MVVGGPRDGRALAEMSHAHVAAWCVVVLCLLGGKHAHTRMGLGNFIWLFTLTS